MKNRVLSSNSDIIIITDTRFPNEIEGMYDNNYETFTIRIERNINTNKNIASHVSETSLDNWSIWDYIIDNNSTLKNLEDSAKVVGEKILLGRNLNMNEKNIGIFTRQSKENLQWVNSLNS